MKSVWLVAGLAAGYVMGTRAGREQYDKIVGKAKDFANMPSVVEAKGTVQDMGARGRDVVASKVNDTLDTVAAKIPKVNNEATTVK